MFRRRQPNGPNSSKIALAASLELSVGVQEEIDTVHLIVLIVIVLVLEPDGAGEDLCSVKAVANRSNNAPFTQDTTPSLFSLKILRNEHGVVAVTFIEQA